MADADPPCTLGSFTASDGYRWRYRRFTPSGSPRAQVVIVHGIQSHGGWYLHSCGRLAEAGFSVSFLDRRGCGLNTVSRGDTPSWRRLVDDVAEYLVSLRGSDSGWLAPLPIFTGGISWGGKLVLALERRHPGLSDGLFLIGPGLYPRVRPPLRQRLAILWARLTQPERLFPIPLNDPELFTANPRWQQFIREDTLALREASARFLVESVRLDRYLRRAPRYVRIPVLAQLAEHDRIIHNAKTRDYLRRLATPDVHIAEYPGAHHTLEFEPNPESFIKDLESWLEKRAGLEKES